MSSALSEIKPTSSACQPFVKHCVFHLGSLSPLPMCISVSSLAMDPSPAPVSPYPSIPSTHLSSKGLFCVGDGEPEPCLHPDSFEEPLEPDSNSLRDEFWDLEELQFLTVEGIDKQGRRILRIVGKHFPAPVVDNSRLKNYVLQKISKDVAEERFCVVYFNSRATRNENCPGILALRWIHETLPQECRLRLEVVYFVHPGVLSRMIIGTLGRFFLSDGLCDKVNYISRIEFLWDHIRKGQIEVPEFVFEHDDELEHRPLMDYWLESDPLNSYAMSGLDSRRPVHWAP